MDEHPLVCSEEVAEAITAGLECFSPAGIAAHAEETAARLQRTTS
ncbi:hypothetical protein [Lentzea sp. CC55]|nr:hypothetical protein [Lentzea sp. CC55]